MVGEQRTICKKQVDRLNEETGWMWNRSISMGWGAVNGRRQGRGGYKQKMRLWNVPSDLTDKNRTIRKRGTVESHEDLFEELGCGGWRGKKVTRQTTKVGIVDKRRKIWPSNGRSSGAVAGVCPETYTSIGFRKLMCGVEGIERVPCGQEFLGKAHSVFGQYFLFSRQQP